MAIRSIDHETESGEIIDVQYRYNWTTASDPDIDFSNVPAADVQDVTERVMEQIEADADYVKCCRL